LCTVQVDEFLLPPALNVLERFGLTSGAYPPDGCSTVSVPSVLFNQSEGMRANVLSHYNGIAHSPSKQDANLNAAT
jgi:hypothetical protein